jgi:hypothetical protein
LSSDSPPLRRASALPRSATWNDYDLLFGISNPVSATAPAVEDCPLLVGSHGRASQHAPTAPFCPLDTSSSAYLILFRHHQHHSKRITPQRQTGSLQVALSKTLRHRKATSSPS